MTGRALSGAWPAQVPAALDLRVEGPDVSGLTDADIRRLFPGRMSGERLNRLRNWPRVVVRVDEVPVGLATYTQTPIETHVPDFAIEVPASLEYEHGQLAPHVTDSLLDAIEIASLAAGCHRVVVIPRAGLTQLERRGYVSISEGCGGSWMQKSLT